MRVLKTIIATVLVLYGVAQTHAACPNPISDAGLPAKYCAVLYASGIKARGLEVAPNGDLLAIDSNTGSIVGYWEDQTGVKSITLASANGLNHGIKYYNGYLYASSTTSIYRWRYTEAQYRTQLGNAEVIVTGMPTGGHSTRTLVFDSQGRLYVCIGSGSNIDANSNRARVVRYNSLNGTFPLTYPAGSEVFADGTRNEVGLRFDSQGRLWGVENGLDQLGVADGTRTDFGDIHTDNPGEEVNLFLEENKSKHYGYPWCFSEGPSPSFNYTKGWAQGLGRGTQWATFSNNAQWTDQTCRGNNIVPPKWVMQGHSAPLDILFYTQDTFPGFKNKVAFVSQHGSWNRAPAVPRKIIKLNLDGNGMPISEEDFFYPLTNPAWGIRPVSLAVTKCSAYGECLFFSDDEGNRIYAIGYDNSTSGAPTPAPTAAPTPSSALSQTGNHFMLIFFISLSLLFLMR